MIILIGIDTNSTTDNLYKMNRRNTNQRQLVLNEVKSRCDHPTADAIYEEVRKTDPSISRGTVYRNLAVLSEEKKIRYVDIPQAGRFDRTVENHNHFVCIKCSKVFDSEIPYNEKLDISTTDNGFVILSHETIFRGLCPDCKNKTSEVKK